MENKEFLNKENSNEQEHTAWDSLIEVPYKAQFDKRVEEQKAKIQSAPFTLYDDEIKNKVGETPSPTASKIIKLGRMLIRTRAVSELFPHVFQKSDKRQELEAMHVAYSEELQKRHAYQQEQETWLLEYQEKQQAEQEKQEKREREEKIKEQAELERNFFDGMDSARQKVTDDFRQERLREMAERDFNDKLTSIEEIQVAAEVGGCGVEKVILKNKGDAITQHDDNGLEINNVPSPNEVIQYNLNGYPFACLFHNTTFNHQKPLSPNAWMPDKPLSQLNNSLSTSYVNTGAPNTKGYRKLREDEQRALYYGFLTLEPNSLREITRGNRGANNSSLNPRAGITNYIDFLETDEKDEINEVYLYTFNEEGHPKKPDCIITYNDKISDYAIEHAAAFNIPIININENFYPKK